MLNKEIKQCNCIAYACLMCGVHVLQMKQGYMRLQALCRSRILTHRFTYLRSKMITFQRHARAFLARTFYTRREEATRILQAGAKMMLANMQYNRKRIEVCYCIKLQMKGAHYGVLFR